ncbi:DUF4062 domain-containing protein [Methanosarcina mazei]|uniref:DUF4062 domain-containing protein n=1 Tax=Methanosarcina mazei TaxID=2209 RepID=A0A6C0VK58_METMZ|nr:DUF4062 domain-containing protein [Methanosarcina mazei]QIB90994.1 DUF4062 domain-containing protein [Methanosarcina mazei]
MGAPKIFVSSTCYDLALIRTELRSFIQTYGFEPIMSEYSDILYDHFEHTQSSCLKEIPYCDMVILIIGGRYGTKSVPQALDIIDIERLKEKNLSNEMIIDIKSCSITQIEFLQTVNSNIPVFTFVSLGVMNDYYFWVQNKENANIDQISFLTIESPETAKYIFGFIEFIHRLRVGNSIATFSNLDEIKNHLRKQWAAKFQHLLRVERENAQECKQTNIILKRISDLETAVFASISNIDLKNIARGINNYVDLIIFLHLLSKEKDKLDEILKENVDWNRLMEIYNIDAIVNMSNTQVRKLRGIIFILKDGTYFQTRYDFHSIDEFRKKWEEFHRMEKRIKSAIFNAILDDIKGKVILTYVVHFDEKYFEKLSSESNQEDMREIMLLWQSKNFSERYKNIKGLIFLPPISSKVT